MAIYYRQADTLSRAIAGTLQKDGIEICAHRQRYTHVHIHNKVPECSVYIIVFEMVMHGPVKYLATGKGVGPSPEKTLACKRALVQARKQSRSFCSDLISCNTFCVCNFLPFLLYSFHSFNLVL